MSWAKYLLRNFLRQPPDALDSTTDTASIQFDTMAVDSRRRQAVRSQDRKRSRRHAPEEARREILGSAARFLREHHFRDLTIGEVMAGTTLSRPAFYQYFRDVHDLIVSFFARYRGRYARNCQPLATGRG
jgi:AcrR family transcriptional regulator